MVEYSDEHVELLELSTAETMQIQGGEVCHGVTVLAYARVDGATLSNADYVVWRKNDGVV